MHQYGFDFEGSLKHFCPSFLLFPWNLPFKEVQQSFGEREKKRAQLLNVLRAAAEDLFCRVFRALWGLPSLSLAGKHNPAAARPLFKKRTHTLPGWRVHFYCCWGQEADSFSGVWDSAPHARNTSSLLIQMRACLWSAARGQLCYGSRRTSGWWALRFSNERSPGMRLRAPSQSLGASLWSLRPPRALFLNVALKSTWGFGGKHSASGWGFGETRSIARLRDFTGGWCCCCCYSDILTTDISLILNQMKERKKKLTFKGNQNNKHTFNFKLYCRHRENTSIWTLLSCLRALPFTFKVI